MASREAMLRMESRATAAEQRIALLKAQISEIQAVAKVTPSYSAEVEALKKENVVLAAQIDEWKKKLVAEEKKNGVQQVDSGKGAGKRR